MSSTNEWRLSEDAYKLLLDKIDGIQATLDKQNGRIGRLEAWRNYLVGAWGAIVAIAGIIFAEKR